MSDEPVMRLIGPTIQFALHSYPESGLPCVLTRADVDKEWEALTEDEVKCLYGLLREYLRQFKEWIEYDRAERKKNIPTGIVM